MEGEDEDDVKAGEEQLEKAFNACVIESYSCTETGRISCNRPHSGQAKRGTVGLPIGHEVGILGPNFELLPTGEEGEIVVRGDWYFDGYENDAEANAEAFVDGWFRTGDAGFFDEDGYLTLTGRIKEVISRGGEKVSPV